jgi:hypothetical protein
VGRADFGLWIGEATICGKYTPPRQSIRSSKRLRLWPIGRECLPAKFCDKLGKLGDLSRRFRGRPASRIIAGRGNGNWPVWQQWTVRKVLTCGTARRCSNKEGYRIQSRSAEKCVHALSYRVDWLLGWWVFSPLCGRKVSRSGLREWISLRDNLLLTTVAEVASFGRSKKSAAGEKHAGANSGFRVMDW